MSSSFAARNRRLGQPWRCFFDWHRWRLRNVCARWEVGAFKSGPPWEIYEECVRCGEERSYYERNRRRAEQIERIVRAAE